MPEYERSLDEVLRMIADPTRRAVVERLGGGPATTTELAEPFDMALPSFMQHLGALEQVGLVSSHKPGRSRIWQLIPGALAPVGTWLDEQEHLWETRLDQLDTYLAKKETT